MLQILVDFDWDPAKAKANYAKHHVTFDEAKLVFYDPFAILERDPVHFERGHLIGMSMGHRVLFVVHVDLSEEGDGIIRIISARKATQAERRRYAFADRED